MTNPEPTAAAALPPPEGPLPDVLGPGLAALFVGFNPGLRSGALGHHYSGRGNQFWRLLADSGLTPRLLRCEEDGLLPSFGLGSTNLVARATASAADLSRAELRAGLPRLARIVETIRPAVLAYTGKGVYLAASGRSEAPWGVQDAPLFNGVTDIVIPSPSGLARLPYAEKLVWYGVVKAEIGRLRPG
jgi:double-stranded uracil-DNA glycosylase